MKHVSSPHPCAAIASARVWLGLVLVALLAGCASQAPSPDQSRDRGDWEAQIERLQTLDAWSLAGKVGLRTNEGSESANIDWQQRPDTYRILISGPFGAGRTLLTGRPGAVTLTNGEGRFEAETPEALMEQQLGWSLPISALDYWVRGLPAPEGGERIEHDEQGFPQQLRQFGWTIEYRDWTRADTLWMPRRLVMTYGELRATLVANQWQLLSDT
ncbi:MULTISPECIES: lipoprotein insertase outer membrane protein LolB [Chromohalobacter]|uniref:Outer-membrane lipoprotein LolB n=1 Tax=Chromohalobacter israelensis (strain ATCC BAA-138 / DSM 3043 / CIP 106854 / NCIMB 13768 / 1H11) TaxID=290398 RepID=LOLB_CHRI1|nr:MULTISPECIES: lipoprotein insertase outer membrane protein LolB [Chromohalobacter]Q1QXC9.1 RecName: Full=Outer-membrane lipoprotein LolB; Flags: Precursor [Chromohalobacter salexigens DSM 3043]ABE58879.1 outer membrane lipoprotein LolB [Chromohalobacter salexigens DSM 3043]MDO0944960.1 lipoprotein insertase outer membrane protein LolB [Chromohalobacter salexigens]NQY44515.1 lipoprotein localization protein LolB [Chromohalobacter sp.]NWO54696.1 outer membrane lipoprotein LolB [Chromohalobact